MKNITLQPCRYCGGEASIKEAEYTSDSDRLVIKCQSCGITLDHTQNFRTVQKVDKLTGRIFWERAVSNNESAIDIWNGCLLKGDRNEVKEDYSYNAKGCVRYTWGLGDSNNDS